MLGYINASQVGNTLYVMLLALITPLEACDCHLFYMLHMIYESAYVCTSRCLYTIMICTDGMTSGMCLCVLLATGGLVLLLYECFCNVMCM